MKTKLLLVMILSSIMFNGVAQNADLRKKQYNLDKGVAISGYDPVAYFKQNKALKGKKEFSVFADWRYVLLFFCGK